MNTFQRLLHPRHVARRTILLFTLLPAFSLLAGCATSTPQTVAAGHDAADPHAAHGQMMAPMPKDTPPASSDDSMAGMPMDGGHGNMGNMDMSGTNMPADDTATTQKTVYTCPMHPDVVSDKPGTCPKCGMTLIKKIASTDTAP